MAREGTNKGGFKILVVSPTPSHPQNAGNRARIFNLLLNIRGLGHQIHFVYCDKEQYCTHVKAKPNVKAMHSTWDEFHYLGDLPFDIYSALHRMGLSNLSYVVSKNLWRGRAFISAVPAIYWLASKVSRPIKGNLWRLAIPYHFIKGNLWRLAIPYYVAGGIVDRAFCLKRNGAKTQTPSWKGNPESDKGATSVSSGPRSVTFKTYPEEEATENTDFRERQPSQSKEVPAARSVDRNGEQSQIDEWYNSAIDTLVKELHRRNKYDAVIAEYVFMSKVLTNFGEDVVKIIDAHDVFTNRNEKYEEFGLAETFFTTTKEEERKGLNRADRILAIQDKEKVFFEKLVDKEVATIGHTVALQKPQQKECIAKNILCLATASLANVHGIDFFIENVLPLIKPEIEDAKLILAGNICRFVGDHEDVIKLGEVRDIQTAYAKADIVINPNMVGTGLKIKTIEALGLGKVVISTPHAGTGLGDSENKPFVEVSTPREFAAATVNVMSDIDIYNNLAMRAYQFAKNYNETAVRNLRMLFSPRENVNTIHTQIRLRGQGLPQG